jgi:hypothetical protein
MEAKNYRTQIIIALIGLIGALGGALIANWGKIFPPEHEIPPVHQNQPSPEVILKETIPKHSPPAQTKSFHGVYVGISTEGINQYRFEGTFSRQGNQITGSYLQSGSVGRIRGTVQGNTLYYTWQLEGYFGKGVSTAEGDDIIGTWGYGNSIDNGGTLRARLQ